MTVSKAEQDAERSSGRKPPLKLLHFADAVVVMVAREPRPGDMFTYVLLIQEWPVS